MNWRRHLTKRRFLTSAVMGAATIGLYTWRVEPTWLEITRRTMPVRNLPQELVGASILHASDLHIGPRVDDSYLLRVFGIIRDLSPDIVVYTGDFINSDTDLSKNAPSIMSKLARGSLGTFGILGNHDYGRGWRNEDAADGVVSLAGDAGVRILRNECVKVAGLQVLGLDDLWAGRYRLDDVLPQLEPDSASIALVHNPDAVDSAGWEPYSGWILAGHTHGGQCRPPFLPPPILPVRNRRYTSGEFDLAGGRRMYISRGIGHLTRVRFNVRPEITLFQLTRET